MTERPVAKRPTQSPRKSRWEPPPDSDLLSIPLVAGAAVAVLAVIAAFVFLGWVGMVVLLVVLIAALAISYRVITASSS
jgi:hypothetical protein